MNERAIYVRTFARRRRWRCTCGKRFLRRQDFRKHVTHEFRKYPTQEDARRHCIHAHHLEPKPARPPQEPEPQ